MGHEKEYPKSKNERHAAWERSGAKRNERHAAWERFLHPDGPDDSPKTGPKKMPKTFILNAFQCFVDLSDGGMAPRRHRAKRAPRCMGARFLQKHVKIHWFFNKNDALNGAILRPQDRGDKKMTTQSGRQRAPKAFAKNIYFPDRFCVFCSSGSIWWPLPTRPSFSKSVKN